VPIKVTELHFYIFAFQSLFPLDGKQTIKIHELNHSTHFMVPFLIFNLILPYHCRF
jgi:hypothetical protein